MKEEKRKTIAFRDAGELRRWLEKNHSSSAGVWLVINRKGNHEPGVFYEEAVEEALCFGWIDGRLNRLDEGRYKLHFSPRRTGGIWAKSNRDRVAVLIREGRMTEAGLARVEEAKRDGSWDAMNEVESLDLPSGLERYFSKNSRARKTYEGWSDSYKKRVIYWIISAKRDETRSRRISQVAEAAGEGKKPFE